jgi:GNAT superfamily N-acetyltransferase
MIHWFEGPRSELADLFALADDSPEQVERYRDLGRVLVARDGGAVIGHLQLVPCERTNETEIKSLAVREDRQGCGIGRSLMNRAIAVCREQDRAAVLVATAAADTGVLRFYQRFGFRFLRVERDVFTPEAGYPPTEVDGVPLRDQVWLSLTLDGSRALPGAGRIRHASAEEAPELELLQRRSSDVWEAYREQLAANPDAIELPESFIDNGWVRVAVDEAETPIGFSVVVPTNGPAHELDGLFVEPAHMRRGVGRALVEDAAARASGQGAEYLEVTAGPAQGFYETVGFDLVGAAETRFGPAVRMRRELRGR